MSTEEKNQMVENQIISNQQSVSYDTREFTVELVVSKYKEGIENDQNEIYVPEYQREFVWDNERRSKFIESVILGLPIPFMFVAEMPDTGRLEIVDGSQRIRTLNAFLDNKLKLSKLDMLTHLEGFYFKDLTIPRQRKFKNSVLRMVVLSDKTTEKVRMEMFKRINKGPDLVNSMELRKGLLQGSFRDFIYKECAVNEIFTKLCPLTALARDRQDAQELILRFFAFYDEYPNYTKGLSNFLDTYLERKNSGFSDDERKEKIVVFENMLAFVEKHFPTGFVKPVSKIRLASKIYFESLSVGIAFALREDTGLLNKQNIDISWLNSIEFKKVVEPVFNTHSTKGIKSRIDFVKNRLLGLPVDIENALNAENEE